MERSYQKFESWTALLAHVDALHAKGQGAYVRYHAPLDHTAKLVFVEKRFKNDKLRIDPLTNTADPFTVDEGHLDRFVRENA